MSKKKQKNTNCGVTISVEELGIKLTFQEWSEELQEIIKKMNTPPQKQTVNYSQDEFFDTMVKLWITKTIDFPNTQSFEKFCKYVCHNYRVRQIRNPKKFFSESSIKAALYNSKRSYKPE